MILIYILLTFISWVRYTSTLLYSHGYIKVVYLLPNIDMYTTKKTMEMQQAIFYNVGTVCQHQAAKIYKAFYL
jgi:trehalose utilization protein